jgi:hypothetical protein
MKRKNVAIGLAIVAVVALAYFMFVPSVWVNTHPSMMIPQLAVMPIPARESLGCIVFGVGAANWPVATNASTYQTYTYHYQFGCPPSNPNGYVYTSGNTTATVYYNTESTAS